MTSWDKPIIEAKDITLTKRDVFNYYADPEIRANLLPQLQNNSILAVQSLEPNRQVFRRNIKKDEPIQINTATRNPNDTKNLAWFTERRFSEFHPVIRSKTDKLWVDIDPGGQQTYEDLKPIVKKVNAVVSKFPEIKSTQIAYSGGRGYYITGQLNNVKDTDEIRKRLNLQLRSLVRKDPELTLKPPTKNQVRLDTSTLHDMGSLRALYSLNSDTGLASVPIAENKLDSFNPKIDAHPFNLVKKMYTPKRLDKEFAPGIPLQKITRPIPEISNKHWTLAIQEHAAKRAGKHWDLRLVDPSTGHAHSWAVPKAKLPTLGDKPLLAIQTPTHTSHYSLNFGVGKPKKIGKGYGAGTVSMKIKEPVRILSSTPNTVKFERDLDKDNIERYRLFRTKDNSWLLKSIAQKKEAAIKLSSFALGYQSIFEKLGMKDRMSSLPLANNDNQTPAHALEESINNLPPPPKRTQYKQRSAPPYKTRMNQPTSWNSPMEISPYMAVGPSPILGYW